jgi:hypothetical protein
MTASLILKDSTASLPPLPGPTWRLQRRNTPSALGERLCSQSATITQALQPHNRAAQAMQAPHRPQPAPCEGPHPCPHRTSPACRRAGVRGPSPQPPHQSPPQQTCRWPPPVHVSACT